MLPARATPWHNGTNFGKAFETQLANLLGMYGLIFIDPLAVGIKALAAPVYVDAVAKGGEIVAAIRQRDSQLAADGFHSQVVVEDDYFPFFWISDDGRRLALRRVGDRVYKAKDGGREFTRAELIELATREPHRLSPGVMLRPVVQDHLLPTACVRQAQIFPVHSRCGCIPYPRFLHWPDSYLCFLAGKVS